MPHNPLIFQKSQKWLGELGLTLPAERAPVEALDATSQTVRPAKKWNSFGGDEAVKAAGLIRLRECPKEEEYQPLERLSPNEDQFEAIVGVPAALGELLDTLYRYQPRTDEQTMAAAQAQILQIVDAMPVGADLGTVPLNVLYDLLYASPWEVTQYIANSDGRHLCMQIKRLHQRELGGECVAPAELEALQRKAVLLTDMDESEGLEGLAASLHDRGMVGHVLSLLVGYATTDHRQYPDWSKAEAARVATMLEEDNEHVREALGDPPKENGFALDTWLAQLDEYRQTRKRERRVEQPDLWARHEAWLDFEQATTSAMCAHVAAVLLSQLRAAGK